MLGVLLGAQATNAQPKPGGTLRFVMKYEPPTLAAINKRWLGISAQVQ
jgi:hypothetical protein